MARENSRTSERREAMDLTHKFLIAMPAMMDPNFAGSVVYVCEHTDKGALGLVINRPTELTLESLFDKIDLRLEIAPWKDAPVYFGGPVQTDRGFVLHRPMAEWHSTLKVNDEVGLTSSRDILQAIGSTGEPQDVIITLGYAGWAAGQLEQELADNTWLTVPADLAIIFELPPEERLVAAMQKLGVDFANLSEVAGHA